jgi:hypothetical protein
VVVLCATSNALEDVKQQQIRRLLTHKQTGSILHR